MRPNISNELLLQVIQAWDPDQADKWKVNDDLMWDRYFIRETDGYVCSHHEDDPWHKASKLVEFLLKDRPDLNPDSKVSWDKDVLPHSRKEWGIAWASDPFSELGAPIPSDIVRRLKSYDYLREWKEKQVGYMKIETPSVAGAMTFRPNGSKAISNFTGGKSEQTLYISTEHPLSILNGSKIRLKGSVPFDMKPGETLSLAYCGEVWCETSRCQQESTSPSGDIKLMSDEEIVEHFGDQPVEVPATYEQLCPHCNGSKEVVGWYGKESCQTCS